MGAGDHQKQAHFGSWMQTFQGRAVYPLDMCPDDIDIIDIAHSLSMQCRFNGHTLRFFSVSEHCCLLSDACSPENRLWGLLHDAAEAYLADVPRPIKPYLKEYAGYEDAALKVIAEKYGLTLPIPDEVKRLDTLILVNERDQAMSTPPQDWDVPTVGISGLILEFWNPVVAEIEFLRRFHRLLPESL